MDQFKFWTIASLLLWGSLNGSPVSFNDIGPNHKYFSLAYDKDWPYQDLRINGETIWIGCVECGARYEALRPLLNRFHRPFSVLELGANNGYFSLRIAEDYDASCVMIDGTERLCKICELNSEIKNIVYLQKYLSPDDIELLSKKEHFDVVLCFHLLHHVDWKRFVSALFQLGDYVVIQTPPVNDGFVPQKPTIPEIAQYLLSLPNGVQIGSFVRQAPDIKDHMIVFSFPNTSPYLRQDFDRLEKFQSEKNQWLPVQRGISLETYKDFNGVFPRFFDGRSN
ncbi:MAG: hypothetical protein HW387_184 [Parachlamydiales bacterium]|nr:hypothetical protein [Parachlamydiales bacterium]